MKKADSLRDIIKFNNGFKTAINLYLSLNKPEKVEGYIPTKSSVNIMGEYLRAVLEDKKQATLLIGPYGKGKSHLLLVLLAILSMDRTSENEEVIKRLVDKVSSVDDNNSNVISDYIKRIWDNKRFLPVLITNTNGDLNQAFLYGLNEALKRAGLTEIVPDTYYSIALERIMDWEKNYIDTYLIFENEVLQLGKSIESLKAELKLCTKEALDIFSSIYPRVTSGSQFNPMVVSDVLPLYKSISEQLVEDYGYSGLYIVFDEFSKFIESQDGTATGNNMKLLQDMCELSTDSSNASIFFTLIAHKSIKEYGRYLSSDIINSFTGIEGRLIEKYFVTSSKNNYELIKNAIIKDADISDKLSNYESLMGKVALADYYQLPAFRSNFQESDFDKIILQGCYPLNPISAYLLLNVSEKVAQNERTLFTFISNDEPNSMARFVAEHTLDMGWSIGADLIYDYFKSLFKKDVANEFIHNIWLSAEYVIDRCTTDDQKKIVKALAIILIVNKDEEISADDKCLGMSVNAVDAALAISDLVSKQLIYKKNSTGTYFFKTRAGSELRTEIKKQRELKGENVNYSRALVSVSGKYYVIPRKYNTLHTMTRYFENEYMDVDSFLSISSPEAILRDCKGDGKVITLYSFAAIKQDLIKKHILEMGDSRIVVVCPKKCLRIQKQLKDFEIIDELRNNKLFTDNNEILKKELPILEEDLVSEIEQTLFSVYEDDNDTKVWFLEDGKVKNAGVRNCEKAVNECCEIVYPKTILINNEMVNRSVISTAQTRKARQNIIRAILSHIDDEAFYAGSNQEATIYRSLFCQTGLVEGDISSDDNLNEVLKVMHEFVDSCSNSKRCVSELIGCLTASPYGMRSGLIPVYLAYVLSKRREDIVVYFADKEVQITPDILVSMCEQATDYSLFISKEDMQKEQYINALNVLFNVSDNRNLSANRIKDIFICMQRWFRALPQVTRNIVDIDIYVPNPLFVNGMKEIKKVMQRVEFNPYEILFVDLPDAFGNCDLSETYSVIEKCKDLFDKHFEWIITQASDVVYAVWGGKRKNDLYHMLREWYESQSDRSKQGLYSGRTTNFMSCVETLNVFNDSEVTLKVVKAVTDVYVEDWNSGAIVNFNNELISVKSEIESIKDESSNGEMRLTFTGRNGEIISKLYSHSDESAGSVLRNIIEDTLDEYDDLSVNDRVSILLDMIEKTIK